MSADALNIKETGKIKEVLTNHKVMRRRLFDLGFIPGTEISCYRKIWGITAFEVKGGTIALRNEDAKHIILES
jgi:Fe2+ transport system protein FeoA